jgi:hypothetical protein
MLKEFKEILREFVADDELFELTAQIMKKSHTALVKAGFTKEQATQIVASQGIGAKING